MKTKTYSLYDNQNDCLTIFAHKLKSKKEVRKALLNYLLSGNFSEEAEKSILSNSLDELCNYYEFSLIENQNNEASN